MTTTYTTDYCTPEELGSEIGIYDSDDDAKLSAAISAASRRIEGFCGRRFDVASDLLTPTVREVFVEDGTCLLLEQPEAAPGIEIRSTTGLIVKADTAADGTFSTTLTLGTDFLLYPRNAAADGIPFNEIRPRRASGSAFPCSSETYLQVTATWGWAEIPDAVHKACLIQAAQMFKAKDAVFGAAALGEQGAMYVRAAMNPLAADQLRGANLQIPVLG